MALPIGLFSNVLANQQVGDSVQGDVDTMFNPYTPPSKYTTYTLPKAKYKDEQFWSPRNNLANFKAGSEFVTPDGKFKIINNGNVNGSSLLSKAGQYSVYKTDGKGGWVASGLNRNDAKQAAQGLLDPRLWDNTLKGDTARYMQTLYKSDPLGAAQGVLGQFNSRGTTDSAGSGDSTAFSAAKFWPANFGYRPKIANASGINGAAYKSASDWMGQYMSPEAQSGRDDTGFWAGIDDSVRDMVPGGWLTLGALALGGAGAMGAFSGSGAAAGAAGAGEAAAAGSFMPSAASSGMLGAGSGLTSGTAFTGMGSMLSPELVAAMGSGAISPASLGLVAGGGGIMTAAGGAAFDAAMSQGLGYDAAMQAAMSAGGEVGTGGAGLFSNLKDAYNAYSKGSKLYNAATGGGQPQQQGITGGSMAIDWGSLLGGAGNMLTQNALLGQGVDKAAELADKIKFTPYAISSDVGQTYQDPTTGQMISKLDPRFAQQQQAMLDAVGSNLAASQADPMLAAQDAYQKMQQLSSFQDQQQKQALEERLMQQGMLGSTGGANQSQAFYNSLNDRNVNQQLQSIGLGQTLSNNAMTRAGQAWSGALQPTQAMANQLGQSGQFGGQAMSGNVAGANLLNSAYQAQLKGQSNAATGLFGSPAISGQGGLLNTGANAVGNWLGGNIGNIGSTVGGWLGGNTSTGYGLDQYANLMSQQGDFNWSGLGGVSAGSAQDMMLNDQWDWSW